MIDEKTTMGAVTLKVADLEKVTRFYRDVVGLQVSHHTATTATLGTPLRPLVHLQHLADGRFLSHAPGLYHLALRVPSRQALAGWFSHYRKLDAPNWQGSADHGVSHALYMSDPEGNGIEIYWDRPSTAWPRTEDGALTMYTRALDLQALLREAGQNSWSGLLPETEMGHIHLKVASIPVARDFYVETLGFELMVDWAGSALFVAAGGYHHHLGLNTWQSRQAPPLPDDAYGLAQFEIHFASPDARQATINQLQAANYALQHSDAGQTVRDPFNLTLLLR